MSTLFLKWRVILDNTDRLQGTHLPVTIKTVRKTGISEAEDLVLAQVSSSNRIKPLDPRCKLL